MEMVNGKYFSELAVDEAEDINGGLAITLTIGSIVALVSGAYGLGYVIGETMANVRRK